MELITKFCQGFVTLQQANIKNSIKWATAENFRTKKNFRSKKVKSHLSQTQYNCIPWRNMHFISKKNNWQMAHKPQNI